MQSFASLEYLAKMQIKMKIFVALLVYLNVQTSVSVTGNRYMERERDKPFSVNDLQQM